MENDYSDSLQDVDKVYVYTGQADSTWADDPTDEQVRFRGHGAAPLTLVRLEDAELKRLRGQVTRLVSLLDSPADPVSVVEATDSSDLRLDEITVHVGLSATGSFFFIANAGVEAALDITWRRK